MSSVLLSLFCGSAHAEIAAKSYVLNLIAANELLSNKVTSLNDTSTDVQYPSAKAVFGAIKSAIAGIPAGPQGEKGDKGDRGDNGLNIPIYSATKTNAATGDEISVAINGLRFKLIKQSSANDWAVRVVNQTGAPIVVTSKFRQYWDSTVTHEERNAKIESGGSFNPDSQSGDIGFGREDFAVFYLFDNTNMHLYYCVIAVNVNKAVITAYQLA
ncbi:MAG: hypothetical protein LBJ73_03585 [Rickettsiales bacterium]|jgi:hypothetical protein|nr:hypothetical protein [Rickettsiales bacterium]